MAAEEDFAEEEEEEEEEGDDPNTPICNVLFANCGAKRKDAWVRRFARTLSHQNIESNENLAVVLEILESVLTDTCQSTWEKENLLNIVANDGEKEQLVPLLQTLTDRVKEKADMGYGNAENRSRYGNLAVPLSNEGAISHKAECEPEHFFRITSEQLDQMWSYLKPPPASARVVLGTWWELRLTNRVWKGADDPGRHCFVLSRGLAEKKERDDVAFETFRGEYSWGSVLHGGDVYDDFELTLEWESGGNTDRHTGEGSGLDVVYRRDIKDSKKLNYVSHTWGRVTTSEMVNIDTMFPPYMEETQVEDLDDAAVDALITASLKRLERGAQAGVEDHGAHIPEERVQDHTEEGADKLRPDWD